MSDPAVEVVKHAAIGFAPEHDGLVAAITERVAGARVVLIGEATHGSQDFYRIRSEVTRALIRDHGFNVVAVEADWPDAYRVNRWVRHMTQEPNAAAALGNFVRFPRWMWRNTEVVRFLTWLHEHNAGHATDGAGFYGLDLYSLHASMEAVLEYLDKVDPEAAARARQRYRCFEGYGEDTQSYGYATTLGLTQSCEDAVVEQLVELRRQAADSASRHAGVSSDEQFVAEQNARLVVNAEKYYRAMFGGRIESWNLRDTHMMETLDALMAHVQKTEGHARAVVWAHNSHLGDARATEMGRHGELNLGQLVRERYREEAKSVGFTTHTGTVTAASDWDQPATRMQVRPSFPASYEAAFHESGIARFILDLSNREVCEVLNTPRLERAIGVIYRPQTERFSHYFTALLPRQFDLIVHVDRTEALEPLESWAHVEPDLAETFPTGL
jgi:erythromycin esterase-like protein